MAPLYAASVTLVLVAVVVECTSTGMDSLRLQKARLRLAEAQGLLPIGSADDAARSGATAYIKDYKLVPSLSRVREISWRVAEPVIKYDPASLSSRFFAQPLRWLARNVQFLVPLTGFTASVLADIVTEQEASRRKQRAGELLDIISAQSPALIKAGQALASRPDLLPKEYLESLQQLQDRCPPYPTEQARALLEEVRCARWPAWKPFRGLTSRHLNNPPRSLSLAGALRALARLDAPSIAASRHPNPSPWPLPPTAGAGGALRRPLRARHGLPPACGGSVHRAGAASSPNPAPI